MALAQSLSRLSNTKGQKFLALQLQQALDMPLVEVWRLAAAFSYALLLG